MLRRQFLQLVYDLRAELGKSVDPAAGVADLPSLKQTICRNYQTAYEDFDWPHLKVVTDRVQVNAGQRHYDVPATLDYDSIETVYVWFGNKPVPLTRGIGFEEYSQYDSNNDERADPVQNWDIRFTGTREQVELWPLPSSDQEIQYEGRRKFTPLVNDSDRCLVDDTLVLLMAAVELLPRDKKGDAQIKLAALQQRMAKKKARAKGDSNKSYRIGLGTGALNGMPRKAIVRIGG